MKPKLTLGSLFDGSGGFPIAGLLCGIVPIWASEVEPFPIRVTQKNLPEVNHLGDIKDIKGDEIPPVDIISFGSPCQDLSIAGKRGGLKGNQSNLFFEAIRIIKEMRWKTGGKKPRYIIWENVPGAFSSNKGEDFRRVLEKIANIKDEKLSIPKPTKWQNTGEILESDYSLSWRVLDAKYFGVPKEGVESSLSQILEVQVPERFYLTKEACLGILKRAKRKGKEIPLPLKIALERQSA